MEHNALKDGFEDVLRQTAFVKRILMFFTETERPGILRLLASHLNGIIAQALFPRQDDTEWVFAYGYLINTRAVQEFIHNGRINEIESLDSRGSNYADFHSLLTTIKALLKDKANRPEDIRRLAKPSSSQV